MSSPLDLSALSKQADEDVRAAEPALVEKTRGMDIKYRTAKGWQLVTVTLNAMDKVRRSKMARVRALATGGIPWSSYAPPDQFRMHYSAVVVSLVDNIPEEWMAHLESNDELLILVGEAAESHSEQYFLRDSSQGEVSPAESRVVLVLKDLP